MNDEIKKAALDRANHKCQRCGAQNMAFGFRDGHGKFYPMHGRELEERRQGGLKVVRIDLRVIENRSGLNLICLCKRCESIHAREEAMKVRPEQTKLL